LCNKHNALAKYGAGRWNFIISNIAGYGSGLDRFRLSCTGSFNITFQFVISAGQTSNEFSRTSPMQTGDAKEEGNNFKCFKFEINSSVKFSS